MSELQADIMDFSPHLFWDFDRTTISTVNPTAQVVERVLTHGLWKDWLLLLSLYGFDAVIRMSTELRNLDTRTLSFLVNISGIPKEKFRCYSTRQLIPPHWNF